MTTSTPSLSPGLEGVSIAESAISLVEGLAGRLSYRGYSIEDITHAENTFEETMPAVASGILCHGDGAHGRGDRAAGGW
jgi:citrate synthase